MRPTLMENQRLILNRWTRTTKQMPERGDIITFEAPDKTYITADEFKSDDVIAKYSNEPTNWFSNFVFHVLEIGKESYIKRVIGLPGDHVQIYDGPENCVFALGDNRDFSTDSRAFGCIPLEKIEGKVWIRFWPLNLFGEVS